MFTREEHTKTYQPPSTNPKPNLPPPYQKQTNHTNNFKYRQPIRTNTSLSNRPTRPAVSPRHQNNDPLPTRPPHPIHDPLTTHQYNISTNTNQITLQRRSNPRFYPSHPLCNLTRYQPTKRPKQLTIPIQIPNTRRQSGLHKHPHLPRHPTRRTLTNIHNNERLPPKTTTFHLPLQTKETIPKTTTQIPSTTQRPTQPRPPRHHFLYTYQRPIQTIPTTNTNLPRHPTYPRKSVTRPSDNVYHLSNKQSSKLTRQKRLTPKRPICPTTTRKYLPPLRLYTPPKYLPTRPPVTLNNALSTRSTSTNSTQTNTTRNTRRPHTKHYTLSRHFKTRGVGRGRI